MQSRYPEGMSDLLTQAEVAAWLKIHPHTIRCWSQKGFLRVYRIGPRRDRRYDRAEAEQVLDWVLERALDRSLLGILQPCPDTQGIQLG